MCECHISLFIYCLCLFRVLIVHLCAQVCVLVLVDLLLCVVFFVFFFFFFVCFFQAEDGIRDLVRSRGLGDVYKRQADDDMGAAVDGIQDVGLDLGDGLGLGIFDIDITACLLYTSDAADERSSVDLGGRRIIKKQKYSIVVEEGVRR